jgi:hypothetical protein
MLDLILSWIFANQWQVVGVVSALLLAMAELGFRCGRPLSRNKDASTKSQIGTVEAAVLGLLGLLLAFTFSMALSRFENRRQMVLDEANAIGTTILRASLLPAPHRQPVEELLRRYVELRIVLQPIRNGATRLIEIQTESAAIQRQLWGHAVSASQESPTPLVVSFVTALNQLIDSDAARVHAARSRVPSPVWILVLLVAGAGTFSCGYGAGSSGQRSFLANGLMPLLIAVVITLIADLDRPGHGLISTSQQPLIDLQDALRLN